MSYGEEALEFGLVAGSLVFPEHQPFNGTMGVQRIKALEDSEILNHNQWRV